jgi:hypothetical protein
VSLITKTKLWLSGGLSLPPLLVSRRGRDDAALHLLIPCSALRRRKNGEKMHVANLCFKCLRGMFQVFHADIVKVDRDIAYVAMVVYVCCKLLFLMFYLFFQTYVASVFI